MRSLPLLLCLAACAPLGPDYQGPPVVANLAARFQHGQPTTVAANPPAEWWTGFNDAELTRLIARARADSPALAVARARLAQSRAAYAGAVANLNPAGAVLGGALDTRIGTGEAGGSVLVPGLPLTLPSDVQNDIYFTGFDASWEADLLGGKRRAAERGRAQAEAAEAAFADAQVQLAAEVGRAYVALRGAQDALAITRRSVALKQRGLTLSEGAATQGVTNALDIARLRADAAATEAQIPLIEAQVDALTAQLAVLTGTTPAALAPELARPRAVPRPPRKVAIGNPADMLRRRPDIREAERRLAASSAAIGETAASFFPKITFMGLVSTAGGTPGAVLRSDGLGLAVGPVLQWNALDFGRKDAALAQAAGVRDEALAGYRQTVLAALADAEGSLSAFEKRRASVARLATASTEAAKATELAAQMTGAGTLSVIDQLDIQRAQLQIDLALSQGRTELATAYIGLNKSLGLGWSPAPPPRPVAEVAKAAMAKAP